MSTLDLRSRAKIALIVERYGGDEAGEAGRRTRALAAAIADRGHDVTVLTTCSRRAGSEEDDVAPGETRLDGVRVVRFKVQRSRLDRLTTDPRALRVQQRLAGVIPWARRIAYDQYVEYLDHRGQLFDAALFTGAWTSLVEHGLSRTRRAVLAPPPIDGCTAAAQDPQGLLRTARAVALATSEERGLIQRELGAAVPTSSFVLGACPEPCASCDRRRFTESLVDGPYVLCVAHESVATSSLVEAFRTFRDAYRNTPFEDDRGRMVEGKLVRLVFGGDPRHVHAPSDGILSLGDLDDVTRIRLVSGATAIIHPDPSARLPQSLLEAWSLGRPTIARVQSSAVSAVFERAGAAYTFESPSTFAACAASLLSRRGPREAFGARARQYVSQEFSPAKVAASLEAWIATTRGRALPVQSSP